MAPDVRAQNATIDRFRRARRDRALAVIEGFHALKHALRFEADILEIIATGTEGLERLARDLAPDLSGRLPALARVIDQQAFAELAPRALSTGVMALARRPAPRAQELLADGRSAPIVLLEEPRDLNNVGASIRVAAAAEAAGVIVTGRHDPWHPDAIRGSAGLHWALPVVRLDGTPDTERALLALDPSGDPLDPARLDARAILAFGSERRGLSQELLARADARLALPMRAGVSSLNLATSVSAALFAWRLCGARA